MVEVETQSSSGERNLQGDELETAALDPKALEAAQRRANALASGFEDLLEHQQLGHYRLLRRIGKGGMGIVFEAHDEQLERDVALKVMRPSTSPTFEERFIREAQAMAQLSHPNVVAVHEIGQVEGARFIVMDLVEGVDLREWQQQGKRSLAEILRVFQAAGRGLVAVHEAGLVHRDFKPGNVLISAKGRVKVADFGLVRHEDEAPWASTSGSELRSIHLTSTGTVLGTPAYMAPEQFLGRIADARSDQFSFCVSLWEAVFGRRPFAGLRADFQGLASAVLSGAIVRPPSTAQTNWLIAVLERGMAVEPEARWPSMAALLDELDAHPRRARRRQRVGAALALAALGSAGFGSGWQQHTVAQERAACASAAAVIEADWNPDIRAQIERGIRSLDTPVARESWTRAADWMDAYAASWAAMRERSCLDPSTQPGVHACLDQRRASMASLVELWRDPELDASMVLHAAPAAAELPPLSTCLSEAWTSLPERLPSDPAARAQMLEQRRKLERARALALLGRYEQAEALGIEVLDAALRQDNRALAAEARLELARSQKQLGQPTEARESLMSAYLDASEEGHQRIRFESASMLAMIIGAELAQGEEARFWGELAERLLGRFGLEGSIYEANLRVRQGLVHMQAGEYEASVTADQRALELYTELLGPEHPEVADVINNMALAYAHQHEYEQALELLVRARTILGAAYGSEHPSLGYNWSNTAVVQRSLQQDERVLASYRQALHIWELNFGPDYAPMAATVYGIGAVLEAEGELDEALRHYERAIALNEGEYGSMHPNLAFGLLGIASIHRKRGEHEAAVPVLERALAVREAGSTSVGELGQVRFELAKALRHTGELERARELAVRGRADFVEHGLQGWAEAVDAWLVETDGAASSQR